MSSSENAAHNEIQYTYIESTSFDPYFNLGLEKYLFDKVRVGEAIFFLWQNEKTVVCGRNQNVYKECSVTGVAQLGGRIARRLSGGGAVFHDLGNLNFTFIAHSENYSVDRQLNVIVKACAHFGLAAQRTGRNDIAIGGRKFSGNAFYSAGDAKCHHGTIMIKVSTVSLESVLNVSREKLASKGVESVMSRVVNLSELCPDITVESMKSALTAAFLEVYGAAEFSKTLHIGVQDISDSSLQPMLDGVFESMKMFSSDKWIFGAKFEFTNSISRRFSWGEVELCFNVIGGTVAAAKIHSDSLMPDFMLALERAFPGAKYRYFDLAEAIDKTSAHIDGSENLCSDIKELLRDSI